MQDSSLLLCYILRLAVCGGGSFLWWWLYFYVVFNYLNFCYSEQRIDWGHITVLYCNYCSYYNVILLLDNYIILTWLV